MVPDVLPEMKNAIMSFSLMNINDFIKTETEIINSELSNIVQGHALIKCFYGKKMIHVQYEELIGIIKETYGRAFRSGVKILNLNLPYYTNIQSAVQQIINTLEEVE